MPGVMSVLEAAAKFHAIGRDLDEIGPAIVARACEMVCAEARRVLGTHDLPWPSLKPETIARKIHGDTPLLETGKMRASIEWNSHGNEGHVGSNSDIAVYMELGTSKIPPRSFLVASAIGMEDKIHKMAAKAVMAAIGGRGLHSREMRELLHLLKHVAHEVKEVVEGLGEDPDKKGKRR